MRARKLLGGLASFVPGLSRFAGRTPGSTGSAEYCYSVWLRHLVLAHENGLETNPRVIAELGPGDSLGMGLAGLLSGASRLFALDVVKSASPQRNLQVLEELVGLFERQHEVPGPEVYPRINPTLDSYDFPEAILTPERLRQALKPERIERIRQSILSPDSEDSMIRYKVPWSDTRIIEPESVDMIFSQAVLEHVNDLRDTYHAMGIWLKPGGAISHQIDFTCHGMDKRWNAHWSYSRLVWSLASGKRPYWLNREPCSTHLRVLKEEGFELMCLRRAERESAITRQKLAPRFRDISDEDMTTRGAFLQARKM